MPEESKNQFQTSMSQPQEDETPDDEILLDTEREAKIQLTNPQLSSTYPHMHGGNMLSAEKAINGNLHPQNFCHTGKAQAGEYWQAEFANGQNRIHQVKIVNRKDGCGERLALAKIEIGGVYFGSLP